MESLMNLVWKLSNEEIFLYVVVFVFAFMRSSFYRYVRAIFFPLLIFSFLSVSLLFPSLPNLLQLLTSVVNSVQLLVMRQMIGNLLGLLLLYSLFGFVNTLINSDLQRLKKAVTDWGFRLVRNTSFVRSIMIKEQTKLEDEFDRDLKVRSRAIGEMNSMLPAKGMSKEAILALMKDATKEEDVIWETGRVSGAVYHGQRNHIALLNEAFSRYSISNPLHPDIWPSVMKFEAEVISMTASLVRGDVDTVCGSTTSGGTESIILAIKAHRDYYRDYHNITEPEMVVAVSAHAAVDKACDLMNIKLTKVNVDPVTFKVNLSEMRRAITPNTIMLYASAPSYPHGAIDPIEAMGRLAKKHNIGLHVDMCLGGFVLPFAKRLGYPLPAFDFSVPGVTSMSVDTHKYGYALKGTSVVLYRSKDLRHSQYFCYADWTGGMYTTPTIAGSRSGGLIAQCWASMVAMGEEGYKKHTKDIFDVTARITEGVRNIEGLKLFGTSEAMIVCFAGEEGINIYSVGDRMSQKGWSLNALQHPPCLHICCTVTHVGRHEEFLKDLKEAVNEVKSNPGAIEGKAAIYGMTSSLPTGPVNELLKVYNDVILKV